MTDIAHRYLRLGLRLGRLQDGLLDTYIGPREIAEAVSAEAPPTPQTVAAGAEALLEELPDSWLRDQVTGIRTYARALTGEPLSFADEVEGCYGTQVAFTDESVFETAHEQLSDLLPGPQSLAERYDRWRHSMRVPADRMAPLVVDAVELGRTWTQQLVALPAEEHLEVELVEGQPWSGFHHYLGNFRGRVRINTDTPRTVLSLLWLVLHETYPGHQAESALKEELLVQQGGRLEETITLVPTPQTLISEGLAEVAPDLVLDGPDAAALASRLNMDLPHARAVQKAAAPLRWAEVNAAMLAFKPGSSDSDVRAYLRRWRLIEGAAAAELMRFVRQPAHRTYVAVYPVGRELCQTFMNGDRQQVRRLLTEQVRVSDLDQ